MGSPRGDSCCRWKTEGIATSERRVKRGREGEGGKEGRVMFRTRGRQCLASWTLTGLDVDSNHRVPTEAIACVLCFSRDHGGSGVIG